MKIIHPAIPLEKIACGHPWKGTEAQLGILTRHQGKNAQLTYVRASVSSLGENRLLVFCFCVAQLAAKWGLRRVGSGSQDPL